jgi:hypothetical protein
MQIRNIQATVTKLLLDFRGRLTDTACGDVAHDTRRHGLRNPTERIWLCVTGLQAWPFVVCIQALIRRWTGSEDTGSLSAAF